VEHGTLEQSVARRICFHFGSTSSYNNILATQPRKQNKEAGSGSQ